jgi:xanthine dehydrogenase FAD-binding subunit
MRPVLLPRALTELWEALDRHPGAALMAGGTDLLVRLRAGLCDPPALIGLERLAGLDGVRAEGGWLRLGAAATHQELIDHPQVAAELPLLRRALLELGSPPIRHMASLGGNLVTASPAGDSLPPLYVYDAEVELLSAGGARRMPLERFIIGPGRTALAPGEVLAAVWVDRGQTFDRIHHRKVGLRRALAIAICGFCAGLRLDAAGRVREARLAWGSLAPSVVRPRTVEQMLLGQALTPEVLRAAGQALQEHISPIDDLRASADYRRQVAANLLQELAE